ncbi:MAG: OsmC family protein [Hyphomicrobiaceae bacterium]
MSGRQHHYETRVTWTGNTGAGSAGYTAYGRDHIISADGKPDVPGSSDPAFRGDATRYNPEDLLVASLSTCHMLWFLHLASDAGVRVVAYTDTAHGTMVEDAVRGGYFTAVELRPHVTVARPADPATVGPTVEALHHAAHAKCFIANSVNFPVSCTPTTVLAD